MSSRGPIAIFVATSVALAAYLFPYVYLPGSWWRAIPSACAILLTGTVFFGRDMPKVFGLRMSGKQLTLSIALFAVLLPLFSYVLFTWSIVEPLTVQRGANPLSQVHQFFQVFNDEILLRAALLTVLIKVFPHPKTIILVPAALFAVAHHVLYRTAAVQIDWPAMVSIFSFAAIANTLFLRFRHIGYGFALHYAWNFYRFNSTYYLDGARLGEGATFNYIEGNEWVTAGSLLVFLFVFAAGKRSPVACLVETTPFRRRLITIPGYGLAWIVTTSFAPLWLPLGALVGVFRRQSFVLLRLLLFLWVYWSLALVTLSACLAIYGGDAARRQDRIFAVSRWYGNALFAWCVRLLALSVVVEGDEHVLGGPLLVLVRHASIVDTALPAALLSQKKGLELRYVLKSKLMIEPCIDLIGHAGPHCFLDRDGVPRRELHKIREVAKHLGEQAVVIYPEGTRFTESKRENAIRALERTRPELAAIAASMTHVLPPKVAGVLELLEAAPEADCLIVAHRGLEGFTSPRDFLNGSVVGRQLEIRMWRIRREDIPSSAQQPRWLFELWKEVGDFVAGPRPTGA